MAKVLWALLKHHVGDDPATAKPMDPDAMDPGFLPKPAAPVAPGGKGNRLRKPPHYAEDPELQACVSKLAKKSPYSSMKFAVADLSKTPAEFAGHGASTMGYAASMPKIAVMYAAHQLQWDLTVLGTQKKLTSAADLFKAARAEWAATQTWDKKAARKTVRGLTVQGQLVLVGGAPSNIPIHGSPHADPSGFPALERIFDVSAVGGKPKVEFKRLSALTSGSSAAKAMNAYLKASSAHKAAKKKFDEAIAKKSGVAAAKKKVEETKKEWDKAFEDLEFAERMFLMIDDSDNRCTGRCVANLGYCYIASALVQSGLYDAGRGGGLWVGADYFGGPGWSPPVGGPRQAATPASMVAFMTLLDRGKLVNARTSSSMLDLLDKNKPIVGGSSLTRSPFAEGLNNDRFTDAGRTDLVPGESALATSSLRSKLGLDGGMSDVALIDRGGKIYAVACLLADYPRPQQLVRELDKCVHANP